MTDFLTHLKTCKVFFHQGFFLWHVFIKIVFTIAITSKDAKLEISSCGSRGFYLLSYKKWYLI